MHYLFLCLYGNSELVLLIITETGRGKDLGDQYSMKCIFCKKPVFGAEGITVPGEGASHVSCFQASLALKRTFQNLEITALNDSELFELKELVLAEENLRNRDEDEGDFELF